MFTSSLHLLNFHIYIYCFVFSTVTSLFSSRLFLYFYLKLKNGKSAGNDMVINEMLKFSLELLVPSIAKVFNIVLKSGIFPSKWNTTFQVPLYKKGDPLNCDNYRGISLTSCLGKVFTGLLAERLQNFLAESSKLSPFQAAFRKNHGTNDHIFTLKTFITKYVKRLKSKLFCCLLTSAKHLMECGGKQCFGNYVSWV